MAPPPLPLPHYAPSHVTEDTPPDLLEGTMDLTVTLPNGKTVVMNVHRSTPMMDLLIQVTTAHRINPGGHVIQVISDNIFLSYKPSTPIGTLDTNAIKIVAKNTLNEMAKMRKSALQQQAIERNIRLKVNLPHNQLAVYRVPPKALISDIFAMICEDKNLDSDTHEIRHPVNVDERLRGSCSLSDYQLQEVCVVSSDFRPPPLSVTDLITMSSITHPEDKKRRGFLGLFSRKAKSSTGDSSVSSGSAGERSVSPARSDESTEGRPTPQALSPASSSGTLTNVNCTTTTTTTTTSTSTKATTSTSHHNSMSSVNCSSSRSRLSRPVSMVSLSKSRKRQAPVPPQREKRADQTLPKGRANGKARSLKETKRSLSRHSSDSSGYHESDIRSSRTSPSSSEVSSLEVTRSSLPPSSNLTTVSSHSLSSVSSSKGKRKAPSPPKLPSKNGGAPTAIPESPEEAENIRGTKPSAASRAESDSCEGEADFPSKASSEENSSTTTTTTVVNRTSSLDVCEDVQEYGKSKKEVEQNGTENASHPEDDKKLKEKSYSETTTTTTTDEHEETSNNKRASSHSIHKLDEKRDTETVQTKTDSETDSIQNESTKNSDRVDSNTNKRNEAPILQRNVEEPVESSVEPSKSTVEGGVSSSPPAPVTSESTNSTAVSSIPQSTPQPLNSAQPKPHSRPTEKPLPLKPFLTHPQPQPTIAPTQPEIGLKSSKSTTQFYKAFDSKTPGHTFGPESYLKSASPDRLNSPGERRTLHTVHRQKDSNRNSNSKTSDSKVNTLPKSTKKKLLGIIPKFGTLSHSRTRFQSEDSSEPHFESRGNDPNTVIDRELKSDSFNKMDTLNSSSVQKVFHRQNAFNSHDNEFDLYVSMFQPKEKAAEIPNITFERSDVKSQPPNELSRITDESHIVVESIFKSNSQEVKSIAPRPIPTPRKRKGNSIYSLIQSSPNKIQDDTDLVSSDVTSSLKINEDHKIKISVKSASSVRSRDPEVVPDANVESDHFLSASEDYISPFHKDIPSDLPQDIPSSKSINPQRKAPLSESLGSSLLGLKSWKTTDVLNYLDHKPRSPEAAIGTTTIPLEGGPPLRSSRPRSSSSSSLCSDAAENEVQTRTVSLSSETSNTSFEMINPKDIQRPKRQKRKKIPEEFLRNSSLKDSSSSSESQKNFERVNEIAEKEVTGVKIIKNEGRELRNGPYITRSKEEILKETPQKHPIEDDDVVDRCSLNEAYNTSVKEISNPSVMYVEMINEEESTTDPATSAPDKKQIYTSKVQLLLGDNATESSSLTNKESTEDRRSVSVTQITPPAESPKQEISRKRVIAELKSAIEPSDDDHPPRILNFKPKGKEWNGARPSDYNVILSFGKNGASQKSPSPFSKKKPLTRSSSASSYESIDNSASKAEEFIAIRNTRSSTESSYESAPPPLPESRVPLPSDSDSKTSSTAVSRQSSFSDHDSREFKPKVPTFSISTYQSRASKLSYDKKLARSESLNSFNDLHGTDEENKKETEGEAKKLTRSDSQRNEMFKSEELKKKSTSTTFLNSNLSEWNDLKSINGSTIRPSFLKSQSRSSIFENSSSGTSRPTQDGPIQFELSSAKDTVTFDRPVQKTFANLRKAKSTFDVRGSEGRIPEGYQTVPDSGLANEYMRLQDDFMKWQQQLLQNQQILHNRVAPIAANPPTLNSVGRVGGGLRLGWKTPAPWMVNSVNQSSANVPPQQRRPIEISIPIRLEDPDDDTEREEIKPQPSNEVNQSSKVPQTNQASPLGSPWKRGPSVPVGAWQERPVNVVKTQPDMVDRSQPQPSEMSRPFSKQPGMQAAFQSAPQGRQLPTSQPAFQQVPQPSFQQVPQPSFQQVPQPSFQQVPQPSFQQVPQPSFQQVPQPSFQQVPQPSFQQVPQPSFQQVPQPSFQQVPQPSSQFITRNHSQPSAQYTPRSQTSGNAIVSSPTNERNDDNINARFSSVVTLSNDKNDQSVPQKDKVRSIVQLKSDSPSQGRPSAPLHGRVIPGIPTEAEMGDKERKSPPSSLSGGMSMAPMSSRLVQQAVQYPPPSGSRVSPPKVERQPSSPGHEPSPPPFAGVKLRPVETRVSPPKMTVPQPPSPPAAMPGLPPPPPPPPLPTSKVPLPPPPPPGLSDEDRRTSTGKKIISAGNAPQLDAREELMMAIRQFGGSGNLKRSLHPPPRGGF